jgi:hypothetical protein
MSDDEQHGRYERWERWIFDLASYLASYLGEQGIGCVCGFREPHPA